MIYEDRLPDLPIDPPSGFYGADYGDWYAENEDKLIRNYVVEHWGEFQRFLCTDAEGVECERRKDTEDERIEFIGLDGEDFDRWCEQEYQRGVER